MKKFVKWSLIIGFIICLLGVGLITAGAMMGGTQGFVSYMRNHDYTIGWRDDGYERGLIVESGGEMHSYDTTSEDELVLTGIQNLDLELEVGKLEIRQEARDDKQDTSLRIVQDEKAKLTHQVYQEDNTLKVEMVNSTWRKNRNWDGRDCLIILYVPENFRFREVKLDAKVGVIDADVLYADELDLEVSTGSITIDQGQVGTLEADCGVGNIKCMAEVERGAEVDCGVGTVSLVMKDRKDQYDYELKCSVGTIELIDEEEEIYTGLSKDKNRIDNGAGRTVELECGVGKITVQFPESV